MPAKLIKFAAKHLAIPLADMINASIRLGQWPEIYKLETITPVPKVRPTKSMDDLRPISNLFTYCKIGEKNHMRANHRRHGKKNGPNTVWKFEKYLNTTLPNIPNTQNNELSGQ